MARDPRRPHGHQWNRAPAWIGVSARRSSCCSSAAAGAQSVPTIDTEDASLGSVEVGSGDFHPILGVDVRNGDFARGGYDDDAANLDRVPVRQLGLRLDTAPRRGPGKGGYGWWGPAPAGSAPVPAERTRPRGWYESNNVVGLVGKVGDDGTLGMAYTIKTIPTASPAPRTKRALPPRSTESGGPRRAPPPCGRDGADEGARRPLRPGRDRADYPLSPGGDAPSVDLPVLVGVGWNDFYDAGTGTVAYGSAGLGYSHPFVMGRQHWRLRAEAHRHPARRHAAGGWAAWTRRPPRWCPSRRSA
ncbi:hypothetical protein AB5I41_15045 [Sphingomonas sp. MMS24-JH45]